MLGTPFKKALLAVCILVVTVGGFFVYRTIRQEPDIDMANEGYEIDFNVKAEEIKFTKSILFHRSQYAVDGGPLKPLQCTSNKRKTIAFFYLDGAKDKAVISCTDEFMGGVTIFFEDKFGEVQELELAQNEGDAGEIWETRSLIVKGDKDLHVARVTLSAAADLETDTPAECTEQKAQLKWNVSEKTFEEVRYSDSFSVKDFIRPTIEDCLNADGSLKKTN